MSDTPNLPLHLRSAHMNGLQVVLPEGMACERMQSAAGIQILSGELMVNERTVEQVRNRHCSPHLHSRGVQ